MNVIAIHGCFQSVGSGRSTMMPIATPRWRSSEPPTARLIRLQPNKRTITSLSPLLVFVFFVVDTPVIPIFIYHVLFLPAPTVQQNMASSDLNPEATPFLPSITSLPTLTDQALTSTLDLLFEPSSNLHTLALPTMRTLSFTSYDDLISTIRDVLLAVAETVTAATSTSQSNQQEAKAPLLRILSAHPRLGEKKVDSAQSRAEQANLRKGGDSEEVLEELRKLNKEYEEKFPGLRYVVFVNGRGRGEVMEDMRRRIARGDYSAEEKEAVEVSLLQPTGLMS